MFTRLCEEKATLQIGSPPNTMNRPIAESSTAKSGEGTTEPGQVRPIADMDPDSREATSAGFEFKGGEYGPESWIICDIDDLRTIKF